MTIFTSRFGWMVPAFIKQKFCIDPAPINEGDVLFADWSSEERRSLIRQRFSAFSNGNRDRIFRLVRRAAYLKAQIENEDMQTGYSHSRAEMRAIIWAVQTLEKNQ